MLKGATINFYCLIDEQNFSNVCALLYLIIECIELNWLCKYMKKVRSSQAAILVLNWVKTQFFPMSIVNLNMKNSMVILFFLVRKYPFCVNSIQKFKRVSLRQNSVPRLNMQNFIVMFTFSILDLFCKFCPKTNLAFWCCLINLPVV